MVDDVVVEADDGGVIVTIIASSYQTFPACLPACLIDCLLIRVYSSGQGDKADPLRTTYAHFLSPGTDCP
jgi:hypothetical protein